MTDRKPPLNPVFDLHAYADVGRLRHTGEAVHRAPSVLIPAEDGRCSVTLQSVLVRRDTRARFQSVH